MSTKVENDCLQSNKEKRKNKLTLLGLVKHFKKESDSQRKQVIELQKLVKHLRKKAFRVISKNQILISTVDKFNAREKMKLDRATMVCDYKDKQINSLTNETEFLRDINTHTLAMFKDLEGKYYELSELLIS